MKVKSSVKIRCKGCYTALREGIVYVCCKTNPRHKSRNGSNKRKK